MFMRVWRKRDVNNNGANNRYTGAVGAGSSRCADRGVQLHASGLVGGDAERVHTGRADPSQLVLLDRGEHYLPHGQGLYTTHHTLMGKACAIPVHHTSYHRAG